MDDIEVSVCVYTYNQEKYIKQCLDSIFMQKTDFNFEVIVGEDASPDNTRQILLAYKEKYGDKLVLVLHDKNLGPSGNAASVRKKRRGKFTASIEGDDYWIDEYKLQKQYDILKNNPQYVAVGSDCITVSADGTVISNSTLHIKKDRVYTMKDFVKAKSFLHGNTMFGRMLYLDEDPRYIELRKVASTMGDNISTAVTCDLGDIYVMKEQTLAHRIAGDEDKSSYTFQQKTKAIEYTYMYIKIHRALEEYFDYRYDFSFRIANRIALLKKAKLLGTMQYNGKEMRKIMRSLPVNVRLDVYVRMCRYLLKGINDRIRRLFNG